MTLRRRWLLLFALGILPLLLTGVWGGFLYVSLAWAGLLVLLAGLDWRGLPKPANVKVERLAEPQMGLNAANEVRVRVHNTSGQPLTLELRDSPPENAPNDLLDEPFAFTVAPNGRYAVGYHISPVKRGDYAFGDVWLRVTGRRGLIARTWRVPLPQAVKVYPPLQETAAFTLMARKGRLQQVGIRAARLQGAGREFESLRDYLPDDEMRRIDWKATARRGKLVARQYEVERSQSVVLALDVGRTMLAEVDGVPKLDYALNAALLLAYVASLSEDRVGLLIFSDKVHTWLPPKKGRAQVYAILNALYNIEASLVESDYRAVLTELRLRWRKRSLLVCFTDIWDAESSRTMRSELSALQSHHLVAAVTLLDTKWKRTAAQEPATATAVYEKAVAAELLEERQKALAQLGQRGVLVVDSPAEKLSAELVNRYLEVKERMLL